jgi:uncharacterized membrane protein (DUF485 family)
MASRPRARGRVDSQGGTGMAETKKTDFAAIAKDPKFIELSRRKKRFLIGWWVFSTLFYFGLPIWAGNTTAQSDVGNMKMIGVLPLLFVYALAQYVVCIFIALYYARWANNNSDRLNDELLRELKTN